MSNRDHIPDLSKERLVSQPAAEHPGDDFPAEAERLVAEAEDQVARAEEAFDIHSRLATIEVLGHLSDLVGVSVADLDKLKKGKGKKGKGGGVSGLTPEMQAQIMESLAKDAEGIISAAGGTKAERRNLVTDIVHPLNLITAAIEAGGSPDEALARWGYGETKEAREAREAIERAGGAETYAAQVRMMQVEHDRPLGRDEAALRRLQIAQAALAKVRAGAAQPVAVVTAPEVVSVLRRGASAWDVVRGATSVRVRGGTRFAGTDGYDFGYDAPDSLEMSLLSRRTATIRDVAQVVFLGGREETTRVAGLEDVMKDSDTIYGAVEDLDKIYGEADPDKIFGEDDLDQIYGEIDFSVLGEAVDETLGAVRELTRSPVTTKASWIVRGQANLQRARQVVGQVQAAIDRSMHASAMVAQRLASPPRLSVADTQEGQDVQEQAMSAAHQASAALDPLYQALDRIDSGQGPPMTMQSFNEKIANASAAIPYCDQAVARAQAWLRPTRQRVSAPTRRSFWSRIFGRSDTVRGDIEASSRPVDYQVMSDRQAEQEAIKIIGVSADESVVDLPGTEEIYGLLDEVNQVLGMTGTTHIPDAPYVAEVAPNDYIFGTHVIGAQADRDARIRAFGKSKPRLGVVLSRSPSGRSFTSLRVGKAKTHADTVANAREVGKRAIDVGRRLKGALAKTVVSGDDYVEIVGARVRGKRTLRISPAKARKLADKVIAAGKQLLSKAKNHANMVQAHAAKTQTGATAAAARVARATKKSASRMLPASKKTTATRAAAPALSRTAILRGARDAMKGVSRAAEQAVLGDIAAAEFEVLGADWWTEIVGAQSEYKGWLVNDSGQYYPDPLWTDAERATEPTPPGPFGSAPAGGATTSTTTDSSGDYGESDYAPDYSDVGPKPTFETLPPRDDFTPDPYPNQAVDDPREYATENAKLPEGVVFNPEQPRWMDIGSVTRFVGGAGGVNESNNERRMYAESVGNAGAGGAGFALERDGGWGNSGYQWGGGSPSIMDGWYLFWNGNTDKYQYKKDEPGGGVGDKYSASLKKRSERSIGFNWGPITGNPAKEETKHLRVDVTTGKTFWYWDTAPEKFKRPYELDRLNKEILDWSTRKAAAELEAANRALQDALDAEDDRKRAKEQARVDADDQRRRDREAADSAHQATLAASKQEAEERQMEIEAQKVELEERRAMAEAVARGEYYPPPTYGEGEGYGGEAPEDQGVDWGEARDDGFGGGGDQPGFVEEGLSQQSWAAADAAQREVDAQISEPTEEDARNVAPEDRVEEPVEAPEEAY